MPVVRKGIGFELIKFPAIKALKLYVFAFQALAASILGKNNSLNGVPLEFAFRKKFSSFCYHAQTIQERCMLSEAPNASSNCWKKHEQREL